MTTEDAPLVKCPNCGETVVECYIKDGTCPDCQTDTDDST